MATVFAAVIADMIGSGIVFPLLPFIGTRFGATPIEVGALFGIFSLAQVIASPIWGRVSDHVGRKPIMLLCTFGSTASYILFAFATSLEMLFFSRILAGILGANVSTALAYITDVTTEKNRAGSMGLIGAAFGVGFTIGPVIVALAGDSFFISGMIAAGFSALSFLLIAFTLREPPRHAAREKIPFKFSPIFLGPFLLAFGQSTLYTSFPLFAARMLDLAPRDVGTIYAAMGMIAITIQGGGVRYLSRKFRDERLVMAGASLMAIGFFIIPHAPSFSRLLVILCVIAIGHGLSLPTLWSVISKRSTSAGATMGVAQSFASVGRMLGPVWGGWLYGFSYGLPFAATAVVLAMVPILVVLTSARRSRP